MGGSKATSGKAHTDIRVKRVYEPPAPEDGVRVLVDRLWPRGLSRRSARVDLWLKEVAPSDALRRWFAHDPARWEVFRQRYFAELADQQAGIRTLLDLAARGPVTLLYAAADTRHNNAVALREYLLRTLRPRPPQRRRAGSPAPRRRNASRRRPSEGA